jgi:hypothetical protein
MPRSKDLPVSGVSTHVPGRPHTRLDFSPCLVTNGSGCPVVSCLAAGQVREDLVRVGPGLVRGSRFLFSTTERGRFREGLVRRIARIGCSDMRSLRYRKFVGRGVPHRRKPECRLQGRGRRKYFSRMFLAADEVSPLLAGTGPEGPAGWTGSWEEAPFGAGGD